MAASLAEVASVETTEAGQTAGLPVVAATLLEVAFPAGIPVLEVADTIPMDQVVDGKMVDTGTTEDSILAAVAALEAEGAQVAPETQGDLTVREEMPRMIVMTADVGEVVPTPASRRS